MAISRHILERIDTKKHDLSHYNFSQKENNALTTFFDLAQEFDSIEDFYELCVAIPKSFYGLEACLYLADPRRNEVSLIAKTEDNGRKLLTPPADDIRPAERPYYAEGDRMILTIRGKKYLMDQLSFHVEKDVLGFLEIYPIQSKDGHTELFFEKYANRIGFRLHNKFLVEKNIEHLKFIRSLVADIEHNIIVPNMVYKLFLRRLRGKIKKNIEIEQVCSEHVESGEHDNELTANLLKEMSQVNRDLSGEMENLEKHYRNMSLFIETLFRRSHFDQGRLTLRTKSCNMKRDVVQPQLERYLEQFRKEQISIDDRLSSIPEEEVINVVDIGLIAQVYANFFSNALKYTSAVDIFGERKKYIAYGHELIRDFFGPGKDGVKYNVFSSGPHIPEEERPRLYTEEFRASNSEGRPGTGHGLAFIRNAIEIHGGVVGYEATQYGNNFYFILPRQ